MKIDITKNNAGLSLGILYAAMHSTWLLLIGLGLGQSLIGLVDSVHFVNSGVTIAATLNIVTVILGVLGAFATGYATAWVFVWIAEYLAKKTK